MSHLTLSDSSIRFHCGEPFWSGLNNTWDKEETQSNTWSRTVNALPHTEAIPCQRLPIGLMSAWTMTQQWGSLVSRLYGTRQLRSAPSFNHIKEQWEEETGRDILGVNWQHAIERTQSSSTWIKHGVQQFKVCHSLHFPRSTPANIYPGADQTHLRCRLAPGTLFHTFWSCDKLSELWSYI